MAETKRFTTKRSTWVPQTGTPKINNNKALNWRGPPQADAKKRGGRHPEHQQQSGPGRARGVNLNANEPTGE